MAKSIYTLDGGSFAGYEQFLKEISRLLFDGAKINNLDAFNDMLSGGYGTPDDGFVLIWDKFQQSKKVLGYSETLLWLETNESGVHSTGRDTWRARKELAKQNQGQTLWMILIDIITAHSNIELHIQP